MAFMYEIVDRLVYFSSIPPQTTKQSTNETGSTGDRKSERDICWATAKPLPNHDSSREQTIAAKRVFRVVNKPFFHGSARLEFFEFFEYNFNDTKTFLCSASLGRRIRKQFEKKIISSHFDVKIVYRRKEQKKRINREGVQTSVLMSITLDYVCSLTK